MFAVIYHTPEAPVAEPKTFDAHMMGGSKILARHGSIK